MDAQLISQSEYEELLVKHSASTVFHRPTWLNLAASARGSEVFYLGLFDGELVAALPVFRQRVYGITIAGSPLPKHATHLAHPLLDDGVDPARVLEAVSRWRRTIRWPFFQLAWHADLPEVSDPPVVEERYWMEISLAEDLEQLWQRTTHGARSSVKKAVRSGIRLHWIRDADFCADYARLVDSTYRRQGIRPNNPLDIYDQVWRNREALGLRILAGTLGGKLIAAAWIFSDHHGCYYWDAASDQEHRKLSCSHLLQWTIVRWARRQGHPTYNLLGVGRAGARDGIGWFKRSLGGVPVTGQMLYWTSPWIRPLLGGYRQYLKFRDRPRQR